MQELVILAFGVVAVLSGLGCYYFSVRYRRRTPGVLVLVMLTGFIFWQSVLWGAVYVVSAAVAREITFEGLLKSLWWPVFFVGVLGTMGTGLLFILIVRRELGGGR